MTKVDVFLSVSSGDSRRPSWPMTAFLDERAREDEILGNRYFPRLGNFAALISIAFKPGTDILQGELCIVLPSQKEIVIELPLLIFFKSPLVIEKKDDLYIKYIPESLFLQTYGEYVCLLPHRDAYYFLYNRLGDEVALSILSEISDIAALKNRNAKPALLERMLTSSGLTKFLQNNSEAFISYLSLGKISEQVKLGHGPAPSAISFGANDGTPDGLEFEFQFGRGITRRNSINVIIGPNGVGKTRAIASFADAMARNKNNHENRELPWPDRVVIYSHDRGSFGRNVVKNDKVSVLPLTGRRSGWKRLTSTFSKLITDSTGYYRSFDLLEHLLADVIPLERLYIPLNPAASHPAKFVECSIKKSGLRYVPLRICMEMRDPSVTLLLLQSAEPLILTHDGTLAWPSSGEMALFLFLMSVITDCKSGSLILIDEPENHLHPQFISVLIDKLYDVLMETDSLAIMVTHSPFVVREVDKACVTIMKFGMEGKSELYVPTLQTRGANVSEISSYVFEDEYIKKGFEREVDTIVENEQKDYTKILEIVGENFGADAVNYLLQIKHEQTQEKNKDCY